MTIGCQDLLSGRTAVVRIPTQPWKDVQTRTVAVAAKTQAKFDDICKFWIISYEDDDQSGNTKGGE